MLTDYRRLVLTVNRTLVTGKSQVRRLQVRSLKSDVFVRSRTSEVFFSLELADDCDVNRHQFVGFPKKARSTPRIDERFNIR